MELPGWSWLIVGIFISGMSGYIYLFVPRDGSPNTSMALFFFIGIIFIAVGIFKIFFKEKEGGPMITSPEHLQKQSLRQQKMLQAKQTGHSSSYAQTHPYKSTQKHQAPQTQNDQQTVQRSHHAPHHSPVQQHPHHPSHPQQHTIHKHHAPASHSGSGHLHPGHHRPHPNACSRCGSRVYGTNFCHHCGQKLR